MQMLGVYWKIQDICYQMGTEIFKIEKEMTEKMKPEVADPPPKIVRILCTVNGWRRSELPAIKPSQGFTSNAFL